MNILFLDDNPERWKVFQQQSIGHVAHWAQNSTDACLMLMNHCESRWQDKPGYSLAYLDHDLGECEKFAAHGDEVVRFIIANKQDMGTIRFIVHSLNQPAAERMVANLRGAGLEAERKPWSWNEPIPVVEAVS